MSTKESDNVRPDEFTAMKITSQNIKSTFFPSHWQFYLMEAAQPWQLYTVLESQPFQGLIFE